MKLGKFHPVVLGLEAAGALALAVGAYWSNGPVGETTRRFCASAFGLGADTAWGRGEPGARRGAEDTAGALRPDGTDDAARAATDRLSGGRPAASDAVETARRIAELEKRAAALKASLAKMDKEDAKRIRVEEESRTRTRVKAGGKSKVSFGANGRYHVEGIGGIDFGTQEGLNPNLQPRVTAHLKDNGEAEFRGVQWFSQVKLDNPVYGFDRADLTHTYDSQELSKMTFVKSFDMTAEGAKAAVDFYNGMLDQVQSDLGITITEKDNSAKTASSNIWRFTSDGSDSQISGGISTWSDNKITVTLSVADRALQGSVKGQGQAAYARGDQAVLESSRVHYDNADRTVGHTAAVELIGGLE